MRENVMAYVNEVGDAIGARFYLVGGTVRDNLLGVEPGDWDLLATGLPWDDLMAALKPFGKTEATGEQFNVIRHFPNDRSLPYLEIALPRKEYSTGVKTQDVLARYDHNMPVEEDLQRRDYSINSMATCCKTGALIDPFDGAGDLERGVLRMLHPDSAKDDSLRIIRGVRFMGRFGFSVDPDTDRQLRENVNLLFAVSGERFQKELLELLVSPHVDVALRYMQSIGALREVFPELERCVGVEQNAYHDYDVWEHTVQVVKLTPTTDPYVKLGALFHDTGKPVVKWTNPETGTNHFYAAPADLVLDPEPEKRLAHEIVSGDIAWNVMGQSRLKFSASNQSRVALLAREHMFDATPTPRMARRFLARLEGTPGGIEANMEALVAIREGDLRGGKARFNQQELDDLYRFRELCLDAIADQNAFKITDLAVNGHDMKALGHVGPAIGTTLRRLLAAVVDEPTLNDRDTLLQLATN